MHYTTLSQPTISMSSSRHSASSGAFFVCAVKIFDRRNMLTFGMTEVPLATCCPPVSLQPSPQMVPPVAVHTSNMSQQRPCSSFSTSKASFERQHSDEGGRYPAPYSAHAVSISQKCLLRSKLRGTPADSSPTQTFMSTSCFTRWTYCGNSGCPGLRGEPSLCESCELCAAGRSCVPLQHPRKPCQRQTLYTRHTCRDLLVTAFRALKLNPFALPVVHLTAVALEGLPHCSVNLVARRHCCTRTPWLSSQMRHGASTAPHELCSAVHTLHFLIVSTGARAATPFNVLPYVLR